VRTGTPPARAVSLRCPAWRRPGAVPDRCGIDLTCAFEGCRRRGLARELLANTHAIVDEVQATRDPESGDPRFIARYDPPQRPGGARSLPHSGLPDVRTCGVAGRELSVGWSSSATCGASRPDESKGSFLSSGSSGSRDRRRCARSHPSGGEENPRWGCVRVMEELAKLGILDHGDSSAPRGHGLGPAPRRGTPGAQRECSL
jgi:hypothetical protein